MNTYIVLYREQGDFSVSNPLGFRCEAENMDHADEQCENAYPGCDIVWAVETDDYEDALDNYYEERQQ
jgi:hypothetical protein